MLWATPCILAATHETIRFLKQFIVNSLRQRLVFFLSDHAFPPPLTQDKKSAMDYADTEMKAKIKALLMVRLM